jgi:hypothetical protein
MTQTFSEGDSVRTHLASVKAGTIGFGPYRVTKDGEDHYMVQREDGTMTPVAVSAIRPHVTYAVGEEAEEAAMGTTVTVEAGPFAGLGGADCYVIKRRNGVHSWTKSSMLRKRTKLAPTRILETFPEAVRRLQENMAAASVGASFTRGFLFKGRTYSLDGEYEDRQGDVWKFNGRQSVTGLPLMDCALYPSFRDTPLDTVISSYGPLSRA